MAEKITDMKKTVFLTGATGNMGWAGFQELYKRKDRFHIRLLARDSAKNHKKLDRYASDPDVTVIWGDLTRYEDVLRGVEGSDYVLHVGGMVSPAADYYPEKTLKVNVTSAENVVKAVLAQPHKDDIRVVYIGSVAQYGDRNVPNHWGSVDDPQLCPQPHAHGSLSVRPLGLSLHIASSVMSGAALNCCPCFSSSCWNCLYLCLLQ